MAIVKCGKCGRERRETEATANFCPYCGAASSAAQISSDVTSNPDTPTSVDVTAIPEAPLSAGMTPNPQITPDQEPQAPYTAPQPAPYPYIPPQPQYYRSAQPYPYQMRKKSLPGEKMVRVPGILFTIFGAINVLSSLNSLATCGLAEHFLDGFSGVASGPTAISNIFHLCTAVLTLIFGIMGIVNSKKPHRATSIIVMGILLLCIQAAGAVINFTIIIPWIDSSDFYALFRDIDYFMSDMIITMVRNIVIGVTIFGTIVGCILPTLYIVGGSKLKKSAKTAETSASI